MVDMKNDNHIIRIDIKSSFEEIFIFYLIFNIIFLDCYYYYY